MQAASSVEWLEHLDASGPGGPCLGLLFRLANCLFVQQGLQALALDRERSPQPSHGQQGSLDFCRRRGLRRARALFGVPSAFSRIGQDAPERAPYRGAPSPNSTFVVARDFARSVSTASLAFSNASCAGANCS